MGQNTKETRSAREPISSTIRFYDEHADEYFQRTVSADMCHLYDRFLSMLPKGGRILDAGCGSGRDLRVFSERGFDPVGIDASSALVEMAKKYSGAPCVVGRLEEIEYRNDFDAIWACASLLHLPKKTLVPVLERLHRALVPRGVLFASVQEGEGDKLNTDGRYYAYYEVSEFLSAVKTAGFVVDDSWGSSDVLERRTAVRWINVLAIAK